MKRPSFMLLLVIPGPFSPRNDIDVYLQTLIEELKELWDVGVETYDVSPDKSCNMTYLHAFYKDSIGFVLHNMSNYT